MSSTGGYLLATGGRHDDRWAFIEDRRMLVLRLLSTIPYKISCDSHKYRNLPQTLRMNLPKTLSFSSEARSSWSFTCAGSTGNLQNLERLVLDFLLQLDGVSTTSTVVDSLTKIQAVPPSILLDNMIEK